ncbi:MAG: Mbeg1-like protein [Nitrospirales bacterium]|nr:DUF2974 domain-containing protein [Nitrospirales bacterium]
MLKAPSDFSENSCFSSNPTRLTIAGWKRAKWFPTQKSCSKNGLNEKICEIYKKAKDLDMHIEVWEKETSAGLEITVVFRGTDSWIDWLTNLNWIGRYIPLWPDQYSLLAEHFSHEFVESLAKKIQEDKSSVSLSAAGHSLGGGLAQYFAYSLPSETTAHYAIPRVSHVYAFDPSPVTGWYIVNKVQRETNAENLIIDRIFEHGEILAYLRLLLSYVNPPSKVPAITEIRYNFDQSFNPFSSHSMDFLACNLCENAKNSVPPKCSRAED